MEQPAKHIWPTAQIPTQIPWLQISLSWGDGKQHAWLVPPRETQRILKQTADFLKPANFTEYSKKLAQSFIDMADLPGASTEGMTPFSLDANDLASSTILIQHLKMGPLPPLEWNDSSGPATWISAGLKMYGLAHAYFGPEPITYESKDRDCLAKAEQRIELSLALIEAQELRASLPKRTEHKPSPSL